MLPAVGEDQPFLEEEDEEGSRKRRRMVSLTPHTGSCVGWAQGRFQMWSESLSWVVPCRAATPAASPSLSWPRHLARPRSWVAATARCTALPRCRSKPWPL